MYGPVDGTWSRDIPRLERANSTIACSVTALELSVVASDGPAG